ncbi:hypothetical protein Tco_1418992 [Tanacetum coccineum]
MNIDKAIPVSYVIDKLSPSWKYIKHTLKHKKEELALVELGNHLCIEESLKAQKPKSNNVIGSLVVNMVEHNNSARYLKRNCKGVKVGNETNGSGTNGSGIGSNNPLKG